ncbi:hypothetical protein K1T71_001071 [Dendrolimus kikuchii]|uniref:Uncharacterized protein n=1 Tax=Dendrolimus kikuchii TaxID=765133 RepID=A0ACC1DGX2_9NEOP|nr:hypothetical protein K1T71_001071 [Dendrolimus kikuchii]
MGPKIIVLEKVSGWEAFDLVLKCIFIGIWQIIKISLNKMWKGHRRKSSKDSSPVELTVDSSIGTHCYIKLMGTKYHYVETGPKSGQKVIILNDAPDVGNLWSPNWANVVRTLAEMDHHVITLDLRGTGGSEGGGRKDLSPPRVVAELFTLMEALGVTESKPAIVIGFGIGGMITWYLVHCHDRLIRKFAVIGATHPNYYWQYPPAPFSYETLHFIQWPHWPEKWLAEGNLQSEHSFKDTTRACDWTGALHYVRGAAWCKIRADHHVMAPALLIGAKDNAAKLVSSAHYCLRPTLRMVSKPSPEDRQVSAMILGFLIEKPKPTIEEGPKTLMSRMLGAVAGRGRELTARLVLPPTNA